MTFSGLFSIGLSGVNAYASSLEAVSQNIANTQTTGYKRADVNFSTLVTSLSADRGAIEGGGVTAQTRLRVDEQGAVTRTGSSTDLAILGDGFFVVSEDPAAGAPFSLTRAGSFRLLTTGELVNDAGFFLRGSRITGDASTTPGSLSALETVQVAPPPTAFEATSAIEIAGRLSADASAGASFTQNISVIDAEGALRNLALQFTARGGGVFDARAAFTDGASETLAAGAIAFDANGALDGAATTFPATATGPGGAAIRFDLAGLYGANGQSALSRASANGAGAGVLAGIEITEAGRVRANYANGLFRDLFEVPLATVRNPQGLEEGKNSTFFVGRDAGSVSLNRPQSGRAGAIEGGALESSTVDIGREFSTLIETQRAYAANTRIISLADELWQTLTQTAA